MTQLEHDIEALLAPAVEALGLELLGVEFNPGNGNALLRLYIDEAERGITLDDCEAVSREVSALLDVHDPIATQYSLEVSSPGLDRPLFKPQHYGRFIGEVVRVALDLPQDGRKRFQGAILAASDAAVTLDQDGTPVQLPYAAIQKARLVPVFEPPHKPGRRASNAAGRQKRGA